MNPQLPVNLRVAFIHQPWSIIDPPVNGADSVALLTDEIARRLAKSCRVLTYSRLGRHQARKSQYEQVEYHRASVSIDRWLKLIMQNLDRRGLRNPRRPFFSSNWCYRQFIGEVLDDLAGQNCDIVHIQNFSQFVPLVRKRLPKVKIVLQMHCEWLNQLDANMVERRMRDADLVLGVSDFLAEKMRQRFPQLAERCRHVYNGADLARFARPSDAPAPGKRIVYVGRLSPEKGVHVLLDAFRTVLERHPDAHLEIIGPEQVVPVEMILPFCDDPKLRAIAAYYRPGAYAKLLRDKIDSLPRGSVSYFNQGLEHTKLVPHYHAASVFTAPSLWEEPFGMPLVEAMAARTPVVATQGGAYPEIVRDGQSGLLVERDDPPALARAICRLLDSPALSRALSDDGFSRALSMFTWERVADMLEAEYAALLAAAPWEGVGHTSRAE